MSKGRLYDNITDKEKADEILSLFSKLSGPDKRNIINILVSTSGPTDGKGNNELDIKL